MSRLDWPSLSQLKGKNFFSVRRQSIKKTWPFTFFVRVLHKNLKLLIKSSATGCDSNFQSCLTYDNVFFNYFQRGKNCPKREAYALSSSCSIIPVLENTDIFDRDQMPYLYISLLI